MYIAVTAIFLIIITLIVFSVSKALSEFKKIIEDEEFSSDSDSDKI